MTSQPNIILIITDQQQIATGRPFFLYLPFGAPRCPFHVPARDIERYRGRFDHGWDAVRGHRLGG